MVCAEFICGEFGAGVMSFGVVDVGGVVFYSEVLRGVVKCPRGMLSSCMFLLRSGVARFAYWWIEL